MTHWPPPDGVDSTNSQLCCHGRLVECAARIVKPPAQAAVAPHLVDVFPVYGLQHVGAATAVTVDEVAARVDEVAMRWFLGRPCGCAANSPRPAPGSDDGCTRTSMSRRRWSQHKCAAAVRCALCSPALVSAEQHCVGVTMVPVLFGKTGTGGCTLVTASMLRLRCSVHCGSRDRCTAASTSNGLFLTFSAAVRLSQVCMYVWHTNRAISLSGQPRRGKCIGVCLSGQPRSTYSPRAFLLARCSAQHCSLSQHLELLDDASYATQHALDGRVGRRLDAHLAPSCAAEASRSWRA